jgi:hypothetical protein
MPSLLEENYPFQEKYKKIHLNKALYVRDDFAPGKNIYQHFGDCSRG